MPNIGDGFISKVDGAYNKVWHLGQEPKGASKKGSPKGLKYNSINTKDATKTITESNEPPKSLLDSESSFNNPITNLSKSSGNVNIVGYTGSLNQGGTDVNRLIPGNNTLYDQPVDSYKYYPPESAGKAGPKGKGRQKGPPGPAVSEKGPIPYSAFNRYTLMKYRGTPLTGLQPGVGPDLKKDYNLINPETLLEPTVTNIIQMTNEHGSLGYRYNYSDFAMCKYIGKIPNNYMITLRRFPFPVEDDIITPFAIGNDGQKENAKSPDIARAITWMSEATGNNLTDMLALDYKYHWEEKKADVQTITANNSDQSGGKLGSGLLSSRVGKAFMGAGQGLNGVQVEQNAANGGGYDALEKTYPNHVFGPYNKIVTMMTRGQDGLQFEKEFTVKFQYEMKGIFGANPKVLFMDQFANILALTYSTAPFWGGEVRYLGSGSIGKPFGNIDLLRGGHYKEFLGSVMNDLQGMASNIVDDIKKNGLGGSKVVSNLLGGALMDLFNSPQAANVAQALLTGDATGQWHITVGNPLNPMMVMGNLIITGTKINFKGGNGVQDFPEEMEVEITLKPGRPRDKSDIESMFNAGRGRFYIKPNDGVDINKTRDVSEYGEKGSAGANLTGTAAQKGSHIDDSFRKFAAD
jgi:hypothetical protein